MLHRTASRAWSGDRLQDPVILSVHLQVKILVYGVPCTYQLLVRNVLPSCVVVVVVAAAAAATVGDAHRVLGTIPRCTLCQILSFLIALYVKKHVFRKARK
ncbi:hypothetical protein PLICRDRAFT_465910, partial [Plicaturopsis crispa FD-325 SS-3]